MQIHDADGVELKSGDRVYVYDLNEKGEIVKCYGTLLPNTEYKHVSEWFIRYDDGQDCALIDFDGVWKDDEQGEK